MEIQGPGSKVEISPDAEQAVFHPFLPPSFHGIFTPFIHPVHYQGIVIN